MKKKKAPLLVNSLPQTHWQDHWLYWIFARVPLGQKPTQDSVGCRDRRSFEGPNRSWLEVSQKLKRFPQSCDFIPPFFFQGTTLCTSSCTWTLDPRWGPVQTAFPCPIFMPVSQASRCHLIQHGQCGSIILQVLSPECRTPSLKAEMLTTCARMLQLLLSYFIITTAHKQKCFTLKDFLGWILMLFFSPAHRWGLSVRRINVGE